MSRHTLPADRIRLSRCFGVAVFFATLALLPVLIAQPAAAAILVDGSAKLSLPFATNETWTLTGGPHATWGSSTWNAIDLQDRRCAPKSFSFAGLPYVGCTDSSVGLVRAAADGIVHYLKCKNGNTVILMIDHRNPDGSLNGWHTGYEHLNPASLTIASGTPVGRGHILGQISTWTGGCGSAWGPHVHFGLWYYSSTTTAWPASTAATALDLKALGGWVAHAGASDYCGYLKRIRDAQVAYSTACSPYTPSAVLNDGSVGIAPSASRFYGVRNTSAGTCVAVTSTANGTPVQQTACSATAYTQQWRFQPTSVYFDRVNNRAAETQVWDVSGQSTSDGAKVIVWGYWAGFNQQWQPLVGPNGYYYAFKNLNSKKCLDGTYTQLQQRTCDNTSAQLFKLELR